jgi:hypothetical protein
MPRKRFRSHGKDFTLVSMMRCSNGMHKALRNAWIQDRLLSLAKRAQALMCCTSSVRHGTCTRTTRRAEGCLFFTRGFREVHITKELVESRIQKHQPPHLATSACCCSMYLDTSSYIWKDSVDSSTSLSLSSLRILVRMSVKNTRFPTSVPLAASMATS